MLRNLRIFFREFSICPVHTGMNRRTIACPDRFGYLPRVYGDEPTRNGQVRRAQ